jgi:hypothetical protein
MTKNLRKAAAQANDPHVMSLWAGQGYRFSKEMLAADCSFTDGTDPRSSKRCEEEIRLYRQCNRTEIESCV